QGARVTVAGQQMRGNQIDLTPGVHRLTVRAAGYETFDRQVAILPGETSTVRVALEIAARGDDRLGPCDQFGPAYNQDNICFDTRPLPLSSTLIPVAADVPIIPRPAILLIKVSREGTTLEARLFSRSNVETFNNEALDMAKTLRWNPAQKNGDPVEAWVQWPFQPVRQ
ncbi:MAG: energy transducer TonB, partial [Candidatus Rokuibacteriota bacterium]